MKKRILVLTALILAFSLCLQGCGLLTAAINELLTTFPSPEWKRPDYSGGIIDYTDYTRPYSPNLDPVVFSEMQYERPDVDALCAALEQTGTDAADKSSGDVLESYISAYDRYIHFNTMSNLVYIHYTLDLNDAYYNAEYLWCEEQTPLVEKALEDCYRAMAASPIRDALESDYFGEGFFLGYDSDGIYSNPKVVELMQQEADLQAQYMALTSDMTVTYEGEELLFTEALAGAQSYDEYYALIDLYCEKYNPLAADLYIRLVKTRRALAQELDYGSYADYAYENTYYRDYTPAQAEQYLADVRAELVPLFSGYSSANLPDMDADEVMQLLEGTVDALGHELATAYSYLQAYELYDITSSSSKMPGSYETYLEEYEAPFMYVSPTGNLGDLLTAAHEFGHFTDGFVNCNLTDSTDVAEVFSQGLEYLTLDAAELSVLQRHALRQSKMNDSLLTFLSQACYYDFECRVFALPDEELTAENLNTLFLQCNQEYGMATEGFETYDSMGWFEVQHFFIAPYYMISYCVSNDLALQVYALEQQTQGAGLEKYTDMLYNSAGSTLLAFAEENGLESPFAEGRVAKLADFLEAQIR